MKLTDLLMLAVNNLKRRKLRTFLTVLGVIIGTASIIVMVSLGIGQSQLQMELIESSASLTTISVYGGNNVYMAGSGASTSGSDEPQYLTDEVIEDFKKLEYVTGASPMLDYYVIAKQGAYEASFSLTGVNRFYLEQIPLGEGKLPPAGDQKLSLIYGNMIARNFTNSKTGEGYWDTGEEPDVDLVNKPVFLIFDRDKYYQSQSAGQQDSGGGDDGSSQPVTPPKKYIVPTAGLVKGGPMDWNQYAYNAYCDIDALKAQLKSIFRKNPIPGQPTNKKGKPYDYFVYDQAEVYVDDMKHVTEVQELITNMGFQASSNAEWVQSSQKQMQAQQAVLGGIGAVSLLVAAIGIANTMMMSIYERTKEIGVMKVLGCDMRNIRDMFLLESGFIGLMGGVIGTVLSYGISKIINVLYVRQQLEQAAQSGYGAELMGNISRIPPWLTALALVFAVLIGMLAGFFPAKRAMKLSPLAAIRNE